MPDNTDSIKKIIKDLEAQRQNVDEQLNYAKLLLAKMTGDKENNIHDNNSSIGYGKNKQLPESTKEKMRIAQQKRQAREQAFKLNQIQDFLKKKLSATTKEVAEYMQLTEYVVKKYMRADNSNCDEYQPDTWKFID